MNENPPKKNLNQPPQKAESSVEENSKRKEEIEFSKDSVSEESYDELKDSVEKEKAELRKKAFEEISENSDRAKEINEILDREQELLDNQFKERMEASFKNDDGVIFQEPKDVDDWGGEEKVIERAGEGENEKSFKERVGEISEKEQRKFEEEVKKFKERQKESGEEVKGFFREGKKELGGVFSSAFGKTKDFWNASPEALALAPGRVTRAVGRLGMWGWDNKEKILLAGAGAYGAYWLAKTFLAPFLWFKFIFKPEWDKAQKK